MRAVPSLGRRRPAAAPTPLNASCVRAAALSLAVRASGAVNTRITALLTPEDIDQATKTIVGYRPPGH